MTIADINNETYTSYAIFMGTAAGNKGIFDYCKLTVDYTPPLAAQPIGDGLTFAQIWRNKFKRKVPQLKPSVRAPIWRR